MASFLTPHRGVPSQAFVWLDPPGPSPSACYEVSLAAAATAPQLSQSHWGRAEPGERFAAWILRFVLFHAKRHPRELSSTDVSRFLEHVVQSEKDPLTCLDQAREALWFLYEKVLGVQLGEIAMPEPPRLLDRLRHGLRVRHYSPRTEDCYVEWARRFIRFHGLRHPNTMGAAEIELFLTVTRRA